MGRIPAWKIKRELWRIYDKLQRAIRSVTYDPLRKIVYDRTKHRRMKLWDGADAFSPRMAVFMLFQPNGLSASTFQTMDYLQRMGWTILVVSNTPIQEADRPALLKHAVQLIERPNVGYDFGAYRDGVLQIKAQGVPLEKLMILNDSTWFPLRQDDTTLSYMETLDSDLVGHVYKVEDEKMKWRDHLESHLLIFNKGFLNHPAFDEFWQGYVMSDDKVSTIARGEKQITQTALAAGLTVEGMLSRDRLCQLLSDLPDAELLDHMQRTVHHRNDGKETCDRFLAQAKAGQPWREDYLNWVQDVLSHSRQHLLSATFVESAMALGGLGFVKKARDIRHHLARKTVLEAAAAGRLAPLDPIVEAEMRHYVENWVPPKEWGPPKPSGDAASLPG